MKHNYSENDLVNLFKKLRTLTNKLHSFQVVQVRN